MFKSGHESVIDRHGDLSLAEVEGSSLHLSEAKMRAMMDSVLQRVVEHLRELPSAPVDGSARGTAVAQSLVEPLPEEGTSFEELLERLFEDVIPSSVNTAGPGYLGYIPGGGIFHAAVADFMAKAVNRYVGYWYMAPAVAQLEWSVLRWFCEMMGYGESAGGVFTSGGSMATFTGIIAARTEKLDEHALHRGCAYATAHTHYSVAKAMRLAGLPTGSLRSVESDDTFRMSPAALRRAIAEDRARGLTPFLIVGTAGTTNTGAIDPLDELATIAEEEKLWLHVDAAYGGFFVLVEEGREALRGIERADSITLDPHKGLCLPYGTGALLVRRRRHLVGAFDARAEYLPRMNRRPQEVDFCGLSPELSRDWRGLRVWLPLKMHGVHPFRENLREKLALARVAEARVAEIPHVEVVASAQLTVIAFRLNPGDRGEEALNALNVRFLEAILRRQRVYLSPTTLDGRWVIRIALLSFRTDARRLEEGLEDIRDAATEVLKSGDFAGSIHHGVAQQARATPEAPALIEGRRLVTYAELLAAAEALAGHLLARGLQPGDHVGICLPRSIDAVVAILAVGLAGGVYVPIDPGFPLERQRFIASDAALRLVVGSGAQGSERELLGEERFVDLHAPRVAPAEALPEPNADPDAPLYLLYTSGSTGRPKGVIGLQGSTLNRLQWMWEAFPFEPEERCLHRTALHFVDSVWEVFGPLMRGLPLVILGAAEAADPDAIAGVIEEHRVTRITLVPSLLGALLRGRRHRRALSFVRLWCSSGERLPASSLTAFRAAFPAATLLNLYGSTEMAGDVTWAVFSSATVLPTGDVPIGLPLPGARLFILDEDQRRVEEGEVGELYVGGPVLARGYHRRPEEEALRFVELPEITRGRLFRTGDRIRRDAHGVFHFVGRVDQQVKIRGVRVELQEVEEVLLECVEPGVDAVVVARGPGGERGSEGPSWIAAFVAPESVDQRALARAMRERLPEAMMPAVFIPMQALPRLPSGKIDRRRLASFELGAARVARVEGALEEMLFSLWSCLLPTPPTSPEVSFYDCGGDSLTLVHLLEELRAILGRPLPIRDLPSPLTVEAMAEHLRGLEPSASAPSETEGESETFAIAPLTAEDREEVRTLLIEAFSQREPMAVALEASRADFEGFADALLHRCLLEPLSFVARERATGEVVGFVLCHDHAEPERLGGPTFEASRDAPRVAPIFALLAQLLERFIGGRRPAEGELLEIAATGADAEADGYRIARALESRVFAEAEARGFQQVITLCTHAVTHYLARAELGMRAAETIDYLEFEFDDRRVFSTAARHRGVTLFEKSFPREKLRGCRSRADTSCSRR